MFLLIQAGATTYNCTVSKFKFHYVSINSFAAGSGVNEATNHLNSIMFLLILRLQSQLVLFFDHLNSIMFLLILSFFASSVFCILYLNSIMFLLIHLSELTEIASMYVFKFHYVSINSFSKHGFIKNAFLYLNSIMFLLIRSLDPKVLQTQ